VLVLAVGTRPIEALVTHDPPEASEQDRAEPEHPQRRFATQHGHGARTWVEGERERRPERQQREASKQPDTSFEGGKVPLHGPV
jgi:hypothetical protein